MPEASIIRVSGPDAAGFLHAIVSSDVTALAPRASQPSLLLTPAGKVVATMWIVYVDDDSFALVTSREQRDDVINGLSRLLIRTKATIEDDSQSWDIGTVAESSSEHTDRFIVEADHLGIDRFDLVMNKKDSGEAISFGEDYEAVRISHGVISRVRDLGDDVIPQEANLAARAVSFAKGCYLGQELVCRIDARQASTPHTYCALDVDFDAIGEGWGVFSNEQRIGEITSYINQSHEGPYRALARLTRKGMALVDAGESVFIGDEVQQVNVSRCDRVNGFFSL